MATVTSSGRLSARSARSARSVVTPIDVLATGMADVVASDVSPVRATAVQRKAFRRAVAAAIREHGHDVSAVWNAGLVGFFADRSGDAHDWDSHVLECVLALV